MKTNRPRPSGERRSNIERRRIVYTAHIPERRSGRERRALSKGAAHPAPTRPTPD